MTHSRSKPKGRVTRLHRDMSVARSSENPDVRSADDSCVLAVVSLPGDGTGSGGSGDAAVPEMDQLLRRVAIIRGPGLAARLTSDALAAEVRAAGGAASQLASRATKTALGGLVAVGAEHTLVVAVDGPLHPAEDLAAALGVPLAETATSPPADFVAALRRALRLVAHRALIDVDIDGARLVTGGPLRVHADGVDFSVESGTTDTRVVRLVEVTPGPAPAGALRIAANGDHWHAEYVRMSALRGLVHVRLGGAVHSGHQATLAARAPLRLLRLEAT